MSNKFIATVVSIDDPDKLGRSKVRIIGKHDDKINIPDKDLPWAVPMKGTDDPSINKIGTGGNGLLVGSKVFVEYWDVGQGQQHLYIVGSVPKSGDEKIGQSQDGTTAIDQKTGDTPTASRSQDINPVASNPIKNSTTTPGNNNDEGKNIFSDVRNSTLFKDLGTIGTIEPREILSAIKKIDPNNNGGIFTNTLSSMNGIASIDRVSSNQGNDLLISKVFADVFFELTRTYSQEKITDKLNFIISKNNPENIINGEYVFSTNDRVVYIYTYMLIEYGYLIENTGITILEIDEELGGFYNILKDTILSPIDNNLRDLSLTKTKLIDIILLAISIAIISNNENNATPPTDISSIINGLSNLSNMNLGDTMSKFTKSINIINQKEELIKQLFSASSDNIKNTFNNIPILKSFTNPSTGE